MIFSKLPDGARFWIGSQIYIKTLEEGSHNAVNLENPKQTIRVPDHFMVQTA